VGQPMAQMREDVSRSLALNKDLQRLVERALQLDQGMKVGWSRDGEPNPKQGEMGIAPGLPSGARLRILGALKDCVAVFSTGGSFTLEGQAGDYFGAWNNGGHISAERGVGDFVAHSMSSGRVVIRDGAGNDAGSCMSGGILVIRGDCGNRIGGGMSAGDIIIHGDVGNVPGVGMSGGRIIINGRCPPIPNGVKMSTLSTAECKKLNSEMADPTLEIPADAVCLVVDNDSMVNTVLPQRKNSGGWDGIALVNSGDDKPPRHSERDTMVLLGERGGECEALGLPLPLLPMCEDGKSLNKGRASKQPFLVRTNPRAIDLVLLDQQNLNQAANLLKEAGGVVLDISAIPSLNSPRLDGLIVSLKGLVGEDSPIVLLSDLDEVERLHVLSANSDVDGCISRLGDPSGRTAASALPLIGRSAAANSLANDGILLGLELDWDATAQDLAIACSAGCKMVICSIPGNGITAINQWLEEQAENLEGWLIQLGIVSIDQLTRKHLRAINNETAATSGLRLSGYGRPLPHWFAS